MRSSEFKSGIMSPQGGYIQKRKSTNTDYLTDPDNTYVREKSYSSSQESKLYTSGENFSQQYKMRQMNKANSNQHRAYKYIDSIYKSLFSPIAKKEQWNTKEIHSKTP